MISWVFKVPVFPPIRHLKKNFFLLKQAMWYFQKSKQNQPGKPGFFGLLLILYYYYFSFILNFVTAYIYFEIKFCLSPYITSNFVRLEKCPGVCVAERLAGFCEAILEIDQICSSSMKCCVSKQIFDGKLPPELVIPSKSGGGSSNAVEVTTTSSPRSPQRPQSTSQPAIKQDQGSTCSGACVSGLFALLCDGIDRTAICPNNGKCCITEKVASTQEEKRPPPPAKCPGFCLPQQMSSLCASPSNILHNANWCQPGTVCCESKSANQDIAERTPAPRPTTTPRPRPPPPPPRPSQSQGGGGDLTSLLLSAAPTILSAATGNSDAGTTAAALLPVIGTLLSGGGGGGGPPNRNPAPQAPQDSGAGGLVASLLPTLVGTFLGGGGSQRVPPRVGQSPNPYRPPVPTAPPTTTTSTTTEKPDDRPECPGTCIASYLSFTCFGKQFTKVIQSEKFHVSKCAWWTLEKLVFPLKMHNSSLGLRALNHTRLLSDDGFTCRQCRHDWHLSVWKIQNHLLLA